MNAIVNFSGSYRWLSNFWPCDVVDNDGCVWRSAEHAYQAMKFPSGHPTRQRICDVKTAGEAKRLGRSAGVRKGWDGMKVDVMLRIVRRKFAPGSDLARKLINTGDAELVEGNAWGDRFWGVCGGEGENQLGRILMRVRAELAGLE